MNIQNVPSATKRIPKNRPMPACVIFFGARLRLGTMLGRFSINYFSGLGLRIRIQGKFRVWGYGYKWLELTLPKILTLTLNPNLHNGIVEGHP